MVSLLMFFSTRMLLDLLFLLFLARSLMVPQELCISEIVDAHFMSAPSVHLACVLDLFLSIDLFPIPLRGTKVIVGMDWLS